MNHIVKPIAVLLVLFSSSSFAGLPKNATLVEKGVSHHGEVYRTYAIECAGDTRAYVTSWGYERKWCEGKNASLENCSIKKKKVARSVCQQSDNFVSGT